MPKQAQQVRRRKVFYIPGYDPMLPRRYRELYRTEGALQADVSGYDLVLKGRRGKGRIMAGRLIPTLKAKKPIRILSFCCGLTSCKPL